MEAINTVLETHSKSELRLLKGDKDPVMLNEVLKARTLAFSEFVGTDNLDSDEFDSTYDHLYLYEVDKKEVIGAYRMGYGYKSDLYSMKQFEKNDLLSEIKPKCLDLGRSFVSASY